MKFILSFLATGVLLSASTCYNLNVGNAATNFNALCNPVNVPAATTTEPVKCATPIVTQPTIECNVPTVAKCDPPVVTKCTPLPVVEKPTPTPVIECPKPGGTPVTPNTPSSATPEPASFALMGFSFAAVGAIAKFRKSR